ncbi:MAG: polyprenyl synthetase [Polaromonas sp.]|uniref:polyprenyl synthetase family protein n=1 Tax=Polaromonas sp. TaxID=1869339 RepID=UPI0017D01E5C|nr:polyprenyl synthetase family protein [Polaromonas sp.]NMM11085.1 polyprenyl synthetase [Polaromonas sp.]
MPSPVHLRIANPHEKLETLLPQVESRMRDAAGSRAGFSESGEIGARSAAAYHLGAGGQRVRARLGLAAGLALGLSDNDVLCIATCAELMHNASLIHDDLQDRDHFRRGQQAVWAKYGGNIAICSGDFLLSAAYCALCTISQPAALPSLLALLHERTAMAIDGQCADLAGLDAQADGVGLYTKIVMAKSGALLGLPLELALLASGYEDAVPVARQACENFAVGYQIFDDMEDLVGDAERIDGGGNKRPALNIVLVSIQSQSRAAATLRARNLGLQHLALCESNAAKLPSGAGALLLGFSADMRRKLTGNLLRETR